MKMIFGTLLLSLLLLPSAGSAADTFGAPLYPGARFDAAASRSLQALTGAAGACYRTADPLKKVVAYYTAHGFAPFRPPTAERATLTTKSGLVITMQNPWLSEEKNGLVKDTLISVIPRVR